MTSLVSFPALGIEFQLNRVAFSIGDFAVYWYGILIAAALGLGIIYASKKSRTFGVDADNLLDVIMIGTVFGIIGARLYYIIFSAPGEFTSFADWIDLRKGGVGFYGAVIGGLASALITCKVKKMHFLPVADVAALGFLLGQGIGRWGNFVNQEAFGTNTDLPWGMTSDAVTRYLTAQQSFLTAHNITVDPALPVHPTFLYESLWCILGFIVLNSYIRKRKFDGELLLMFFAWNGVGRAIIEGFRTDSLYIGSYRISQLLAVFGALLSVIAILVIRSRIRKNPDRSYLMPYGKTPEWVSEQAQLAEKRAAARHGKDSAENTAEVVEEDEEEAEKKENRRVFKASPKPEAVETTEDKNEVEDKPETDEKPASEEKAEVESEPEAASEDKSEAATEPEADEKPAAEEKVSTKGGISAEELLSSDLLAPKIKKSKLNAEGGKKSSKKSAETKED